MLPDVWRIRSRLCVVVSRESGETEGGGERARGGGRRRGDAGAVKIYTRNMHEF